MVPASSTETSPGNVRLVSVASCGTHGCAKTLNDCSGADHGTCIDVGLELQNPDVLQSAKNVMGEFPTCKCKPAYTGENCAEKVCKPTCKNGGTCLNGFCHCKFGWAGADCAQPACGEGAEKVKTDGCATADGQDKCGYVGLPITGAGACSGHGKCALLQGNEKTYIATALHISKGLVRNQKGSNRLSCRP